MLPASDISRFNNFTHCAKFCPCHYHFNWIISLERIGFNRISFYVIYETILKSLDNFRIFFQQIGIVDAFNIKAELHLDFPLDTVCFKTSDSKTSF
ncbi:hypothetical protein SDC9_189846 [bioreactor metagenome]|uniref:Uncharacterized protein n=1 Tax=bioreactor metagenome TaxID=1076179 RepID=A0A645HVR8_9ZZZZ